MVPMLKHLNGFWRDGGLTLVDLTVACTIMAILATAAHQTRTATCKGVSALFKAKLIDNLRQLHG
jgi:Tfp pilus assembly protein PilE